MLDASAQLFWERGYAGTSIQDILRAAKVHAGSLYHAFPTKQEILMAVLERYRDGIQLFLLAPAWTGVADPIDRIFALLAQYRRSLASTDCFYGYPIGSLALELHEPDPAVRKLLAENFDAWTAAVEGCLRESGSRIPALIDRGELASFVLTTMEGAVMQARTHRDIARFDASVRQLREYFVRLGALPASARRGSRAGRTSPPRKRSHQ